MRSIPQMDVALNELESCITMLQAEISELKARQNPATYIEPQKEPEKKMTQSERMKAIWAERKQKG